MNWMNFIQTLEMGGMQMTTMQVSRLQGLLLSLIDSSSSLAGVSGFLQGTVTVTAAVTWQKVWDFLSLLPRWQMSAVKDCSGTLAVRSAMGHQQSELLLDVSSAPPSLSDMSFAVYCLFIQLRSPIPIFR